MCSSDLQVTLLAANIESVLLESLPAGVEIVATPSAGQMHQAALEYFPQMQVAVMAAAVADYQPVDFQSEKIKKNLDQREFSLRLRPTADILADLASKKRPDQLVAGFAAETGSWERVLQLGKEKALRKGADIIFINQVGTETGFGDIATKVCAGNSQGSEIGQFSGNKPQVATQLVKLVGQQLQ